MSDELPPGLYIVATPIGNLGDLGPRAAETLRRAQLILAEDTRVTGKLLRHIGAETRMVFAPWFQVEGTPPEPAVHSAG